MVESTLALMQGINALASAGKTLISAANDAKLNAQLLDFQNALITLNTNAVAVQVENQALRDSLRDAQDEVRRARDWNAERSRYKLMKASDSGFVYALRQDRSEGEPAHWLCTACFEKGRKSILQGFAASPKETMGYYLCGSCSTRSLRTT